MSATLLADGPATGASGQSGDEAAPPLMIVHALAPAPFGGLESVVHALAVGQRDRGHRVHVVAVVDSGGGEHPFVATLRRAGVSVDALPLPPRAYHREREAVRELCLHLAPDVLHTHGYRADVLYGGVARALGIATVSTVHGFTGGGWKNRLYERLQRRAFRRFGAVVAVSRRLAAELVESGVPAARVQTVRNAWCGGPPPLDRAEARRALGVADGTFHVGWVGRVSHEKGLDVLVDALPALSNLPLTVSVLGEGPQRVEVEARAAALGVGDRVRFHGAVPQAGRWMAAFDAFVLSSRTEGTPVSLLEAIAAGVPVVAAAVGGVPDVVGPGEALLVPPGNPAALAAALEDVHARPAEAAVRAARARARVADELAPGPWLHAYDTIYRRVARAGSTLNA